MSSQGQSLTSYPVPNIFQSSFNSPAPLTFLGSPRLNSWWPCNQSTFYLCNIFFSWLPNIECLLKLQELQGSVIECCSCKLRTLLPANGVDGLDKNTDLLKAVLQSEEEEQKLCNFCIQKVYPSKPATFYCSECDVLMCGSCSDVIHSQLEFRCHDITRASTVKDGMAEIQRSKVSSPRSSSSSTLSKRSSSIKPGLSSRPSSGLLDYSAIPGKASKLETCLSKVKLEFKLFLSPVLWSQLVG